MGRGGMGARLAGIAVAALTLSAAAPYAAAADDQQSQSAAQPREPDRHADFLFGPPRGSIAVRGNWLFASANSDLFDFVTDQLTLDKKDFNSPGLGAYFSLALNSRF